MERCARGSAVPAHNLAVMAPGVPDRLMKIVRFRDLAMRHRRNIQDRSILAAILLVGLFVAFEVNTFANEDKMTVHEQTIELDEVLLLGGLLAVGLLSLAIRRNREQKLEVSRRIAAE